MDQGNLGNWNIEWNYQSLIRNKKIKQEISMKEVIRSQWSYSSIISGFIFIYGIWTVTCQPKLEENYKTKKHMPNVYYTTNKFQNQFKLYQHKKGVKVRRVEICVAWGKSDVEIVKIDVRR